MAEAPADCQQFMYKPVNINLTLTRFENCRLATSLPFNITLLFKRNESLSICTTNRKPIGYIDIFFIIINLQVSWNMQSYFINVHLVKKFSLTYFLLNRFFLKSTVPNRIQWRVLKCLRVFDFETLGWSLPLNSSFSLDGFSSDFSSATFDILVISQLLS